MDRYTKEEYPIDNTSGLVISPPYLIDELKHIVKVSCGESKLIIYVDYYLVCDAIGQAWSFGMNNDFQLGLGERHKHTNTRNPL
jgi:alpha-tubulin suppressor-like RCC1 family protein